MMAIVTTNAHGVFLCPFFARKTCRSWADHGIDRMRKEKEFAISRPRPKRNSRLSANHYPAGGFSLLLFLLFTWIPAPLYGKLTLVTPCTVVTTMKMIDWQRENMGRPNKTNGTFAGNCYTCRSTANFSTMEAPRELGHSASRVNANENNINFVHIWHCAWNWITIYTPEPCRYEIIVFTDLTPLWFHLMVKQTVQIHSVAVLWLSSPWLQASK
jgi:hypothetical protein